MCRVEAERVDEDVGKRGGMEDEKGGKCEKEKDGRVCLLLIFHRCWRNGIDNAFPSRNTCLVFSKFEIRMSVSSNPRKIR